MNFLILIFNFWFISVILFFCVYLDLKSRKIPNSLFKYLFIICIILNFIEFIFCFEDIIRVIVLKFLFLFIILSLSFLLFFLHIIGGADGKLFMLIFFVHPVKFLTFYFITSFLLLFSLLILLIFMINFANNINFRNNDSFEIFFNTNYKFSSFKRSFIKTFFKFLNFSELEYYNEDKHLVKSLILIYNSARRRIQILVQYRPPLIFISLISYFPVLFILVYF